jgi:hypothetical protein
MSWHLITSTTHIVNKQQQVDDGSLKGIPISVTKQAAWANQSSKVDKFRHIPHQLVVAMTSNVDFHNSIYPLVLSPNCKIK